LDSSFAALYYPWITVAALQETQPLPLPPSAFVAGICARVDAERGVWKAPAGEPVHSAVGLEVVLDAVAQEPLNAEGINVLRLFAERGVSVWGARLATADAECKYVNVRRLLIYVERSIDRGLQWVAFEPNGEALWEQVRRTVEDFLLTTWRDGALLGAKPEEAFFVHCDRTTMTQDDLDNGRLVCLVGVAAVRPAEFIIVRIGVWTGDHEP
jgi:phage tail sheath protein FI